MRAKHPPRLGTGADLLRLAVGVTLLALLFPMGIRLGPLRIVTVDVVLLPLVVTAGLAVAAGLPTPRWRPSERGIMALLVLILVGSLLSLRPATSLDLWTLWVRAGLFYFVVRTLLEARVLTISILFRILTVLWAVLLFVGLVQVITGSDFGVLANYVGESEAEQSAFGDIRRVSGTTSGSNVYGQWLVMFSLVVNARLLLGKDGRARLTLVALLVALELVVLLGTLSRANIAFFFVSHALLVPYWIRSRRLDVVAFKVYVAMLVGVVLLGAAVALYVSGGVVATLALRLSHTGGRLLQIQHGLDLLRELRIVFFGTGLGTFYPTIAHLGIPISPTEAWQYAGTRVGIHNGPLLLLVEGGIGVAALFLWLTWDALKASYRGMRILRGGPLSGIGTAFWLMLLTFVLFPFQLYMSPLTYPMLLFVFFFYAVALHLGEAPDAAPGDRAEARTRAQPTHV